MAASTMPPLAPDQAAVEDYNKHSEAYKRSLQGPPDITSLPPLPSSKWPAYMLNNPGIRNDEKRNIRALETEFKRSAEQGYFQSHQLDQMFTGADLRTDDLTLMNNYMKIIFGGKPDDSRDNIQLAYNHALRQMAEAPTQKDSLLGHQSPLAFVPGEQCTKDSLLKTFAEQRRFYKGAIDTDTERFLKTRPTHRLIHTTFYGKNLGFNGMSGRFNYVRGQNHLLYRPTNLQNFKPIENLSSRTFAPDGMGGEVPLDYESTNGLDPRAVDITNEPRTSVEEPPATYGENDLGQYAGRDTDRYLFNYADNENPGFAGLFYEFKPRM